MRNPNTLTISITHKNRTTCGYAKVNDLQADLELGFGDKLNLAILSKLRPCPPDAAIAVEIDAANPVEAEMTLRAKLTEILNPQPRTPLTCENLLKWAHEEVATRPFFTERVWDAEQKQFVSIERQNSVARELAQILHAGACFALREEKSSDLQETISDLYWHGTRGFREYTEKEALSEIMNDYGSAENSSFEFNDLEDLLEEFRMGETEEEWPTSPDSH